MVFLNPNDNESPFKQQQHEQTPSPRHRNNLEKLWSKFSLITAACLGKKKPKKTKNLALSASEIKRRMPGIPVHKVTDYGQFGFGFVGSGDKHFELFYISKSDAQDLLNEYKLHHPENDSPYDHPCRILDFPLSHVVTQFEEYEPLIRLVPELSQVKNAIELLNIDGKNKVDEFDGVPVFQSDCVLFKDEDTGDTFSPAFLRKEDLEILIEKTRKPEERDIIKVSAFEDIIQKMKDNSTSESNNTLFVGAGITSWTWFQL